MENRGHRTVIRLRFVNRLPLFPGNPNVGATCCAKPMLVKYPRIFGYLLLLQSADDSTTAITIWIPTADYLQFTALLTTLRNTLQQSTAC